MIHMAATIHLSFFNPSNLHGVRPLSFPGHLNCILGSSEQNDFLAVAGLGI